MPLVRSVQVTPPSSLRSRVYERRSGSVLAVHDTATPAASALAARPVGGAGGTASCRARATSSDSGSSSGRRYATRATTGHEPLHGKRATVRQGTGSPPRPVPSGKVSWAGPGSRAGRQGSPSSSPAEIEKVTPVTPAPARSTATPSSVTGVVATEGRVVQCDPSGPGVW